MLAIPTLLEIPPLTEFSLVNPGQNPSAHMHQVVGGVRIVDQADKLTHFAY